MKTKKFKTNRKLLELYLIKLRTYEQYDKKIKNMINININQTLMHFKKALRIIFKFHVKNKRILFLGLHGLIVNKINKETNHIAIPSRIKLQGLISNKNRSNVKNNSKYSLLKLKKKPNLVVIFDKIESYTSILTESYHAKIPIINFGNNINKKNNMLLYNIPANIEFLLTNKFFFVNCIKFIFKKFILKKKPVKPSFKKIKRYEKKKI